MIYHVTCNTDDNYLQHCCAMLCSLFENNKEMTFHVHLLTHSLAADGKSFLNSLCQRYGYKINVYDVDEMKLEGVKFRKNRPLTKAAYYRILLPEILAEDIERVLYLDCDIMVLGSVKELYEIDLSEYALAACQDACPYTDLHRRQLGLDMKDRAFCSGLMMINLKYWRKKNSEEKLLEYSKRDRDVVYLHDQDSLNYVFKNQWYVLPYKWGVAPLSIAIIDKVQKSFDIEEYVFNPKIIHYASPMKPWFDVWTPQRKPYLDYLKMSDFPDVRFVHVKYNSRIKAWINNIRYIINRYIRPFIPDIFELIIYDIYKILIIIYTFLFKPRGIKKLMLSLWLRKY